MKVELPEIESFNNPVVRLERTGPEIVYQTFDAKSLLGYPIIQALHEGIETGQTSLTVPDVDHATRTYACLFLRQNGGDGFLKEGKSSFPQLLNIPLWIPQENLFRTNLFRERFIDQIS